LKQPKPHANSIIKQGKPMADVTPTTIPLDQINEYLSHASDDAIYDEVEARYNVWERIVSDLDDDDLTEELQDRDIGVSKNEHKIEDSEWYRLAEYIARNDTQEALYLMEQLRPDLINAHTLRRRYKIG